MPAAWNIDDLPNPHLATTLEDGFVMDEAKQKIVAEYPFAYGCDWEKLTRKEKVALYPLRLAHLRAAHLSDYYDALTEDQQKKERAKVFTSWFHPDKPGELCNNVDNLIAALYLWVEFVEKGSRHTRGVYFRRDPKTKYEVVRLVMSPPKIESEPAKTAIVMPRYTTKTCTIIRQLCKMMAIVRPRTEILMSQFEEERTKEEIGFIREDVENNEVIHSEFGGRGVLFPKSSRGVNTWSNVQLDFLLHPGCRIKGKSYHAAMRGRHPIFCVLDDVEDEKKISDQDYRRQFFGNLFGRYMGMMGRGSKLVWMGTVIENSCISLAMRGSLDQSDGQDQVSEIMDTRFNSWNKFKIGMIRERADGTRESIMPDHVTVEGYDAKVEALGLAMASAELDGNPLGYGATALIRDERKHGYMHCKGERGEEYFLDLHTGERMPWDKFLKELLTGGALDPADSTASDADYGAVNVSGVNPHGKFFILDQLNKRIISDEWPAIAMQMCMEWDADMLGIERVSFQTFILRIAMRVRRELEEAGQSPPRVVPIENAQKNKVQRILGSLRPLYRKNLIAFPHLSPVTIGGVTHTPVEHPHKKHLIELKHQLDLFTDEGKRTDNDDAADSCEMTIRMLHFRKGQRVVEDNPVRRKWEEWERLGISFSPGTIPEHYWTDEMRKSVDGPPVLVNESEGDSDFYDIYD